MPKETVEYLFRVGEGANRGTPVFIWLELRDGEQISVFEDALVTLSLRDPNDFHKAQEVAAYLNDHIAAVGYQKPIQEARRVGR